MWFESLLMWNFSRFLNFGPSQWKKMTEVWRAIVTGPTGSLNHSLSWSETVNMSWTVLQLSAFKTIDKTCVPRRNNTGFLILNPDDKWCTLTLNYSWIVPSGKPPPHPKPQVYIWACKFCVPLATRFSAEFPSRVHGARCTKAIPPFNARCSCWRCNRCPEKIWGDQPWSALESVMSLKHLHYHQNKLISKSTDSSFYSETLNEDSENLTLKIKKQLTKKYI